MQPMRRLSMHQWTIQFFPFWGGREEGIFFPLVSNVFPSSFQDPKVFPIVLSFIPYDLPKVQLPCIQIKKISIKGAHSSLFCNWGSKDALLLGECPMFQKELSPLKKQEKVVSAPMIEFIYQARKVVCFVLFVPMRSTELRGDLNWDASDHVFFLFGKLLKRRGASAWFHAIWTCIAKVL